MNEFKCNLRFDEELPAEISAGVEILSEAMHFSQYHE